MTTHTAPVITSKADGQPAKAGRYMWLAWREARPIVQFIFQLRFLAGGVRTCRASCSSWCPVAWSPTSPGGYRRAVLGGPKGGGVADGSTLCSVRRSRRCTPDLAEPNPTGTPPGRRWWLSIRHPQPSICRRLTPLRCTFSVCANGLGCRPSVAGLSGIQGSMSGFPSALVWFGAISWRIGRGVGA